MNILTTSNVIINFDHVEQVEVIQLSKRAGIQYHVRAKLVGGIRNRTIRVFDDSGDADDMVDHIFSALGKGKRTYCAEVYKPPSQQVEQPPTDEPDADDESPLAEIGDQTPTV